MSSSLSFRIQAPNRPSPLSRASNNSKGQQQRDDDFSSDSDDNLRLPRQRRDEAVTGFDSNGTTARDEQKKVGPLVIASIPNKDWRNASSSKRSKVKKERYIPDAVGSMRVGGSASTGGATGLPGDEKTQGGMGTRDVINDSVVVGGLEMGKKKDTSADTKEEELDVKMEVEEVKLEVKVEESLSTIVITEEQRALRELMAGEVVMVEQQLEVILPAAADSRGPPLDESDAFRQDVLSRPDQVSPIHVAQSACSGLMHPLYYQSTLEDYARVPVGQFGLALLRGMGWKEGTAASRTGRKGPSEAFVPTSRPALLGIGAKPLAEVLGEEKGKNGKVVRKDKREDMKYVPLLKQERGGSASATNSGRSVRFGSLFFAPCFGSLNAHSNHSNLQTPAAIGSSTPRDLSPPSSSRPSSSSRPHSHRPSNSPPPSSSRHRDEDRRRNDDFRDRRDRDLDRPRERDNERERDRKRPRSPNRDRERSDYRDKERRRERSASYEREKKRESRDGERRREERSGEGRDRDRDDRRDRDRNDGRDQGRDSGRRRD